MQLRDAPSKWFETPQRAHSVEQIEIRAKRCDAVGGRNANLNHEGGYRVGAETFDSVAKVPIIPTNSSVGNVSKGSRKEVA